MMALMKIDTFKTMTKKKISLVLMGGYPGAGKTTLGKRIIEGQGVYLDKDTLTQPLVESLLVALGSHCSDRESTIYQDHVKDAEYAILLDVAFEQLDSGHHVLCTAPFIGQFFNKSFVKSIRLKAKDRDINVFFIWLTSSSDRLKANILNRGEERDDWKLSHWNKWYNQLPKSLPPILGIKSIDTDAPSKMINHVINNLIISYYQ